MCRAMSTLALNRVEDDPARWLALDDLARERYDLHEILVAKLSRDGAKDSRAARVVFLVDHHRRVLVKTHVAAVLAKRWLPGADDDAADDFALLDIAAG